jgi:hypothetical protein
MLNWSTELTIKSNMLKDFKCLFIGSIFAVSANSAFSQSTKVVNRGLASIEVACFKSVIKEPLIFYGNPMDTFTLYDGTRWKISNGGAYEHVPLRHRDVLICPEEKLLVVDKRAMSISKIN